MAEMSAAAVTPHLRGRRRARTAARLWAVCYVLPALLVLLLVVAVPLIENLRLAFTNLNLVSARAGAFVGLANFVQLAQDSDLRAAVGHTLIFAGGSLAISFSLGLLLALLLDQPRRLPRLLRALAIAPWTIPYIVVAFLFSYIFDSSVGIANDILQRLGIIQQGLPWLENSRLAMVGVIVANSWSHYPFFLVMFAAGLQTVPQDVVESAQVDGAGGLRTFRHIKLAYLRPVLAITTLLTVVWDINSFPLIWTMTGGGPGTATTTLAIYIYQLTFHSFAFGYAAAIGVLLVLCLTLLGSVYVRLLTRAGPT